MRPRISSRTAPALLGVALAGGLGWAALAGPAESPAWTDYGGPGDDFSVSVPVAPWPDAGPPLLWDRPLGAGFSAIVGDSTQLVTMYRDGEEDVVLVVDPDSGSTLWEHRYQAPARSENLVQFGVGPHATPLLLEDRIVTLGYTGVLLALDRRQGEVLWSHDLVQDFGAQVTPWGFSASPILHREPKPGDQSVDEQLVRELIFVLAGGPQGVLALDPEDGSVRWKSEAGTVSYTTPRVISVAGREQLIFFAKDAIRALDPNDGSNLWSLPAQNGYENHASNLVWDGKSLLWVASQQETAGRALRLGPPTADGAPPEPKVVWRNPKVRLHHWNASLIDGTVFASLGDTAQIFSAVDLETGEILWRDRRFGLVKQLRTASGSLLLGEDGQLTLVKLSREGAQVLASSSISQSLTRTVPTLIAGRLYLRDEERMRAFDLSSKPQRKDG